MKKLINKKTGEIAFIDLYTNTITFSHSKTTHKISIQKDPDSHSITKITTSPEPIPNPNPIPKIISEPTPNPIINTPIKSTNNNSLPNNNTSNTSINISNEPYNTPINYSTSSHNINKTTFQNNEPQISISYPNSLPTSTSTSTYKQSA